MSGIRRKTRTRTKSGRLVTIKDFVVFLFGCTVTAFVVLQSNIPVPNNELPMDPQPVMSSRIKNENLPPSTPSSLNGLKVLVAVVAFDFSQVPHLEELLDSYYDLSAGGSVVDVVVYSTVPWPVRYIDMLNTRFPNNAEGTFTITIHLKSPSTRLHLVDFHRTLFYERLDDYDLFIYTEDDIRVGPGTVATYMAESKRLESTLGQTKAMQYNVGVVRYEYSFPSNMIIDDGTRHVTQNVTRVYWEHSWRPAIPKALDQVPPKNGLPDYYVEMQNHHQGMYLATQDRLKAWKDRCAFNEITDRPHAKGKPHQPSEGTQRVWMSSNQLYGKSHCGVQQVIPMDQFGALSILHLPNKNYRRVGRKGRLGGASNEKEDDSTKLIEKLPKLSDKLLTALELHIEMRRKWPAKPKYPYQGIKMINTVQGRGRGDPALLERMKQYQDYVERGGVMSKEDMEKMILIEDKDE